MGLSALPLLMTGEEVRDIAWRRSRAVDPAAGEWGQGLGGAGGGDCRPIRRSPAARSRLNDVPTFVLAEKASGGAGGVDVRADMMTTRLGPAWLAAACGEAAAGGGVSTVVSQRMGLCGETCL